jgi:hypothetical protein
MLVAAADPAAVAVPAPVAVLCRWLLCLSLIAAADTGAQKTALPNQGRAVGNSKLKTKNSKLVRRCIHGLGWNRQVVLTRPLEVAELEPLDVFPVVMHRFRCAWIGDFDVFGLEEGAG